MKSIPGAARAVDVASVVCACAYMLRIRHSPCRVYHALQVFTDAIREAVACGFHSAKNMLDLTTTGACVAADASVCLLHDKFFNEFYVRNLYGSQNFGAGYARWTDEADRWRKNTSLTTRRRKTFFS